MDYGMIGKIDKARRYSQEKDRIVFGGFEATIQGENNPHAVKFENGQWNCDCNFFLSRGVCSHTMALERVLEGMLPAPTEVA